MYDATAAVLKADYGAARIQTALGRGSGTATEAATKEEWSYLMDTIQQAHMNLSSLDNSLGALATKLKPVKVNLPTQDGSEQKALADNSPAIMQLQALNERMYWIRENVEALTESLQV